MAYILIVIAGSYSAYSTISMQEFDSKRACEVAASEIRKTRAATYLLCVPKGDQP